MSGPWRVSANRKVTSSAFDALNLSSSDPKPTRPCSKAYQSVTKSERHAPKLLAASARWHNSPAKWICPVDARIDGTLD